MNSPQLIMLDEKIVWSKQENIETDFLQKKLNWNFPDLNPLLTDHNVFSNKIHATHPLDSLVNYFNEIDTVSISLWGTLAIMALIFVIVTAVLSCYCCPTIVSRLCCCASKTHCLATMLKGRQKANIEFARWKEYTAAATEAAAEAAQRLLQGHPQPQPAQWQPPTAPPLEQRVNPLPTAEAPSYALLRHSEPAII